MSKKTEKNQKKFPPLSKKINKKKGKSTVDKKYIPLFYLTYRAGKGDYDELAKRDWADPDEGFGKDLVREFLKQQKKLIKKKERFETECLEQWLDNNEQFLQLKRCKERMWKLEAFANEKWTCDYCSDSFYGCDQLPVYRSFDELIPEKPTEEDEYICKACDDYMHVSCSWCFRKFDRDDDSPGPGYSHYCPDCAQKKKEGKIGWNK